VTAVEICAEELRRHDHDRFLTTLFARPPARARLVALFALNLELARIAESVKEPMLGEIRLQWWRETLDGVRDGKPREHPVAQALVETGAETLVNEDAVNALIEARKRDLGPAPPVDRAALERYAEGTSATVLTLALDVLEIENSDAREAARCIGLAWTLVGTIRSTRFLAQRGRTLYPAALMKRVGVSSSMLDAAQANQAVRSAVAEMAAWAREHLAKARMISLPRAALPPLLLASLADGYLARLATVGYDPFDPRLVISPLARQARLMWRAAINRP
jgi:phytoene synthase